MMNIKQDMKCLWKSTFLDTDEYINLVFDNYFNINMCLYLYVDNHLVSSMLLVNYKCKYTITNNIADWNISVSDTDISNVSNMIYLCGLNTLPEYRQKGIMSQLIKECNCICFDNNYMLSFLIPADDNLRKYYTKFGYVNISHYRIFRYIYEHDFCKGIDVVSIDSKVKYLVCYKECKYKLFDVNQLQLLYDDFANRVVGNTYINNIDINLEYVYNTFRELFDDFHGLNIYHTYKDFLAIIKENTLGKGKILLLTSDVNKPLGLLFCSNITGDEAEVKLLLSLSEEVDNYLLQSLKYFLPRHCNISVRKYVEQLRFEDNNNNININANLMSKVSINYSPIFSEGDIYEHEHIYNKKSGLHPLAMAKILNVAEILKFAARMYPCSEFTILIKHDEYPKNIGLYVVKNGKVCFLPMSQIEDKQLAEYEKRCRTNLNWFQLTVAELASLLWRTGNPDTDKVIAIPRLPINVALLLE